MYVGLNVQELGGVGCRPTLSAGPDIRKYEHPGTGKCGWWPIIGAPPAYGNSGMTQSSQPSSASTATP
jgi:hypothetical protein